MKRLLQLLPLLLLGSLLWTACGGSPTSTATPANPISLNVFAASSLTESFKDIATTYKKTHPNVSFTFNFAGSQLLEQQIANGAAADIFASADQANMQKANTAGLVKDAQVFARNKLVLIVPASNPEGITSLKDLTKKGLKLVIGAPTVPAGKYTRQIIENLAKNADYGPAYRQAVLANVVSQEDNVKSVVQKVQLNEADAGFVYQSDVTTAVSSKLKVIVIPDTLNIIAQYPIAVVKNSPHALDAQEFVQYILSADGQASLLKYHFLGKDG